MKLPHANVASLPIGCQEHTHLETIFAHNVSAIYYDNLFSLIYQLIRLILKPNLHKTIAKNAYEIVINHHTQISRAKELIRLVNLKIIFKIAIIN